MAALDAEAQTLDGLLVLREARGLYSVVGPEGDVQPPPKLARRAVVGLAFAGAIACAVGFALAPTGQRPWQQAAAPAAAVGGEGSGGLIQDNAWDSCDVDWVIKRRIRDNLGGHNKHEPKGMRFEVERHGGGLATEQFLLDVLAPHIHGGDRSGNGPAVGSLYKLHLAHGHPLWLRFSLWDMEHKHKLTMENFHIGVYDLDESKKGGHHEFIIAKPSMVARVGSGLEVKVLNSGKMKFQATKFGLGEDDPSSNTELTSSQEEKYVRLVYNNVKDFTIGFGWTNPDHGIPREISFSLHDPEHCSDPIAAHAVSGEVKEDAAESSQEAADRAEAAEEAREEAEDAAEEAEEKAAAAKEAQEEAEEEAADTQERAQRAEAAQKRAAEAAKKAEELAEKQADAAQERAEAAEGAQEKAEAALEEAEERAEDKVDAAEDKLEASQEKQEAAQEDAENAEKEANAAQAAQDEAEQEARKATSEMKHALSAEREAKADAKAAQAEVVRANHAQALAESRAEKAEDATDKETEKAKALKDKADCAEEKAKANQHLRAKQKAALENMKEEINDLIDAKPAPCPDCD